LKRGPDAGLNVQAVEYGGGRSQDDRAAAREERERARVAREQGLDYEDDEQPPRDSGGGWQGPDLGGISRYGGGIDVYTKRRIVAGVGVVVVLLLLFLLLGGC
jgi:hypothetical protein